MMNTALEVIMSLFPQCGLGLTCIGFHSRTVAGATKNLIYSQQNRYKRSLVPHINSYLVPESRGRDFPVLVLNHTTKEVVKSSSIEVLSLILSLSDPVTEFRGRITIEGSTRFCLEDRYEIRPLCSGLSREQVSYGLVHI